MTNDANLSLARELMQAIRQTDEWDRIWTQDPAIRAAHAQLEAVMEPIESEEFRDSLFSSAYALVTAGENAAICYGARVALALLNATAHP